MRTMTRNPSAQGSAAKRTEVPKIVRGGHALQDQEENPEEGVHVVHPVVTSQTREVLSLTPSRSASIRGLSGHQNIGPHQVWP